MKNLNSVSKKEQNDFLNSFDHILCDIDGVLWIFHDHIPGANEAIKSLKKIGKKINFVSNNSTKTPEAYYDELKSSGYDIERDDLITPVMAMISYLKKIDFSEEIYLIGMTAVRNELENAGFKVIEYADEDYGESVPDWIRVCIKGNENVGAVIADIDVNLTYVKLQKAATYLRKPEVIFITGGGDVKLVLNHDELLIGPGCFQNIIENITERKPLRLAKPSIDFNNYIKERLKITDPSRVLFIGDSILDDMAFAENCGYKKLLVLSGLTKKYFLTNWKYPEEYKPDYYVDSLKTIHEIISDYS